MSEWTANQIMRFLGPLTLSKSFENDAHLSALAGRTHLIQSLIWCITIFIARYFMCVVHWPSHFLAWVFHLLVSRSKIHWNYSFHKFHKYLLMSNVESKHGGYWNTVCFVPKYSLSRVSTRCQGNDRNKKKSDALVNICDKRVFLEPFDALI